MQLSQAPAFAASMRCSGVAKSPGSPLRLFTMVFELQPDIMVNNRNGLPGDFATPEQRIEAAKAGAWETCMTLNGSCGYQHADDNWKTSRQVIRNLISCMRDEGNYLLNIGPRPDGSIPEDSVRVLTEVGEWLARNGGGLYPSQTTPGPPSQYE